MGHHPLCTVAILSVFPQIASVVQVGQPMDDGIPVAPALMRGLDQLADELKIEKLADSCA
jgi:hypothetical protein